MKIIAKVAVIS